MSSSPASVYAGNGNDASRSVSAEDTCIQFVVPNASNLSNEHRATRDSFRHGRLPFEMSSSTLPNPRQKKTTGLDAAIDQLFDHSSHDSPEHRAAEQSFIMPRPSSSIGNARPSLDSNASDQSESHIHGGKVATHTRSASSMHLQNMRISQHLRCMSSSGSPADDSWNDEIPWTRKVQNHPTLCYHRRSSSGFDSDAVPREWGKVIYPVHRPEAPLVQNLGDDAALDVDPIKRDLSEPKPVSLREDCRLPNTPGLRARHEAASARFDGPHDQLLLPGQSAVPVPAPSPSARSIGTDYDETAAIWEKAIAAHHEGQIGGTRSSSFSRASRRSSNKERKPSDDSTQPVSILSGSKTSTSPRPSFALKRMDTSHSFDLLAVPSTQSVSQPGSPQLPPHEGRTMPRQLSSHSPGRRSLSQPPASDTAMPISPPDLRNEPTPGIHTALKVPDIVLITTDSSLRSTATINRSFDTALSKRPWSRFSIHDRVTRNGSAGNADNVIVRDFQPIPSNASSTPTSPRAKFNTKKRRRAAFKAGTFKIKQKLFTELPSVFKGDGTFRRREHGHRSSISAGGTLEYPELELLGHQGLPSTISEDLMVIKSEPGPSPDSTESKVDGQEPSTRRSFSGLGSSFYGSEPVESPVQSDIGSLKRTSEGWAKYYSAQMDLHYRKPSSASVSPLDGAGGGSSGSLGQSPATQSLPSTLKKDRLKKEKYDITRAMSEQELRRSTQDLHKKLEDDWRASIARLREQSDSD